VGGSQAAAIRPYVWTEYNIQGLMATRFSNAGGNTVNEQLYAAACAVAAQWLPSDATE
jgi:hypothetical protein